MSNINQRIIELKERYEHVRIRKSDNPNETIDNVSFVWIDGEKTEEELGGLCAIDSEYQNETHQYAGDYTYLVCGECDSYGDDPGEIIIRPQYVERIN